MDLESSIGTVINIRLGFSTLSLCVSVCLSVAQEGCYSGPRSNKPSDKETRGRDERGREGLKILFFVLVQRKKCLDFQPAVALLNNKRR